MQEKIKNYLTEQGFNSICIDYMPAFEKTPEVIGMMEWDAPISQPIGEVTHYLQIQVRRTSYDTAKSTCQRIMELLDSGMNEELIWLDASTSCVARPRRAPIILERGTGYTTFYCEIAIWINE